jgi:ubiquinol-cytochrome c reductase cytochrome c subunit
MTRHLPMRDFAAAAGALLLTGATGVAAQAGAADLERGRQLYMANGCFTCHGSVGQGGERGAGPKLAPEPLPFEAFKALVRQPREAMPRLDARFVSDEQLQEIHRYLASIPTGPSPRDIPVLQSIIR